MPTSTSSPRPSATRASSRRPRAARHRRRPGPARGRRRGPGSGRRTPRRGSLRASSPPTNPVAPVTSARMQEYVARSTCVHALRSAAISAAVKARALTICGLALAGLCAAATSVAPRGARRRPPARPPAGRGVRDPHLRHRASRRHPRLFVTERDGAVRIVRDGHKLNTPFLDIRPRVSTAGEGGLLSIAFPRDYERSRRFYVFYSDGAGNIRIDEFRARPATPTPSRAARGATVRKNYTTATTRAGSSSSAGRVLYAGLGDGGARDSLRNAQSLRTSSASSCASTPAGRAPARTACRAATPSGAAAAWRDLLVRPAQPLPLLVRPPRATSSSPTWARTRARRSTSSAPGGRPGSAPELRLEHLRGDPPLPPGPGSPALSAPPSSAATRRACARSSAAT